MMFSAEFYSNYEKVETAKIDQILTLEVLEDTFEKNEFPLHHIILNGKEREVLKYLKLNKNKLDLNLPNSSGMTPIMLASLRGMKLVLRLLFNKVDIEIEDTYNNDLFYYCLVKNMQDVCIQIIKKGVTISPKNMVYTTTLHRIIVSRFLNF